jgi:hypothetical protein
MNEKNAENERIEELLKRARLTEPSPRLKEQVITEAKRVWNRAPLELPWLIPVRRLAASAAAAALIVWLANCSSNFMLPRWRAERAPTSNRAQDARDTGVEALPEMPYSLFARRLATFDRRSFVLDASALSRHVEALRHALNELQQSDVAKPPAPTSGRSRLILNRPNPNPYCPDCLNA